MDKSNNKGFTIIELMVAVAIVAILAAIAIPSYLGIQRKAARGEAKSNLLSLSVALEAYIAENSDYGPTGVYTYYAPGNTLDNFGPPHDNLHVIANLGNNNNYEYRITISSAIPPSYGISAIPRRGRVQGDMTPWVKDDGQKGPANFGW